MGSASSCVKTDTPGLWLILLAALLVGCFPTALAHEFEWVCDPRATAVSGLPRYSAMRQHTEWYTHMMTYVISEGRLFGLNPSEWSMMLIGVTLCGLMTLLF